MIMNTTRLLVPTDFSLTAYNALIFALQMAGKMEHATVTIMHAFIPVLGTDEGTAVLGSPEANKKTAEHNLNTLRDNLASLTLVPMETLAEPGDLEQALKHVLKREHFDMVVMGITGAGALEQAMMGSNAVRMAHHASLPVVIVPPDAVFEGFGAAGLCIGFREDPTELPWDQLKSFLENTWKRLHIITYMPGPHEPWDGEALANQQDKIAALLNGSNYRFSVLEDGAFEDAIDAYATQNNLTALFAFPRKHTIWNSIFHTNHTKKLAYHTHLPLITLGQ
jgi:nucleotide-binding universal stress UspA family protein